MTTALFIDTTNRNLVVSAVSLTSVSELPGGIVMRYGGTVGKLWQLTSEENKKSFKCDLPIVIPVRGYSARSSEGFVDVIGNNRGRINHRYGFVVGVQGMPWQNNKALSVVSQPLEVVILRPNTTIAQLPTHADPKSRGGWNSNPAAAAAAKEAVEIRSKIRTSSVFVSEGQSDYTKVWELSDETTFYKDPFVLDLEKDHRDEMFSFFSLFKSALRRFAHSLAKGGTEDEITGTAYTYAYLLMVDPETWAQQVLYSPDPYAVNLIKGELLKNLCEWFTVNLCMEGWELGIDTSVANDFLQAITPKGVVVGCGYTLHYDNGKHALALLELSDASDEDREKVLAAIAYRDRGKVQQEPQALTVLEQADY